MIIPLYNAEKYIGMCLESILIQTLQDFEVIVVNDCSTDNSPNVVESYFERFGGRLRIISLPKNTGNGGIPRNVGLEYAHGEYIYFVDSDDLFIDNALETLFHLAKKHEADVVSMMSGFSCNDEPIPKTFIERQWLATQDDIYRDDNMEKRLKAFYTSQFEWVPWSRFLRREFLVENNITFPAMKTCEDVVWNLKLIFAAKRWLRINIPLYVQRVVSGSHSRRKRSPEQTIIFRTSPLISGIDCLDKFMSELEYFKKNPMIRLQLLNFFLNLQLDAMKDAFKNLNANVIYEIFLREFKEAGSTQPALIAQLLLMNNLYRNELMKK